MPDEGIIILRFWEKWKVAWFSKTQKGDNLFMKIWFLELWSSSVPRDRRGSTTTVLWLWWEQVIVKGPFWGAYLWRGLYSERPMYGKFAFKNLILGRKFTVFLCFILYLRAISKYKLPRGLIFGGAIERRLFCVTSLRGLHMEGLIFGILRYFK